MVNAPIRLPYWRLPLQKTSQTATAFPIEVTGISLQTIETSEIRHINNLKLKTRLSMSLHERCRVEWRASWNSTPLQRPGLLYNFYF